MRGMKAEMDRFYAALAKYSDGERSPGSAARIRRIAEVIHLLKQIGSAADAYGRGFEDESFRMRTASNHGLSRLFNEDIWLRRSLPLLQKELVEGAAGLDWWTHVDEAEKLRRQLDKEG